MGSSQSRNEESGIGHRCTMDEPGTSSSVMQEDNRKRIRSLLKGMSHNDTPVQEGRWRDLLSPISWIRPAARGRNGACTNRLKVEETTSTPSSTPPVLASFKTKISGRFGNNCIADYDSVFNDLPDDLVSSVSTTLSNRRRNGPSSQASSMTLFGAYGKARQGSQRMARVLDIPSPVPSVSEPSEDSVSLEREAGGNLRDDGDKRDSSVEDIEACSNRHNVDFISCCTKPVHDSKKDTDIYVAVDPVGNEGSNDRVSPSEQHQTSSMANGMTDIEYVDETTWTTKEPTRPNSLMNSGSRWTNTVNEYGGRAPLAESECFVIENSPAVELLPPFSTAGSAVESNIGPAVELPPSISIIDSPRVQEDEKNDRRALSLSGQMQSRLKNASMYVNRQRAIYESRSMRSRPDWLSKMRSDTNDKPECDVVISINSAQSEERRKQLSSGCLEKQELHDSGIKIDSVDGSIGDTIGNGQCNGKTNGSPEGSIYRGLIDDEIRDQPDLTIGVDSPRQEDDGCGDSPMKEPSSGTYGRPVRLKDTSRKRSASNLTTNSFTGTVSSLSVDSEDMMLDFDESVEESDACEVSSVFSSLGRRRSRSSIGTTNSWSRRKGTFGKRPSLEAVIDEWTSLKDEVATSIPDDDKCIYDNSPSTNNRILKPPVSLESVGSPTVNMEQQSYRHMVQDVTVMKTLLLRLKRTLQEAETSNPFDNLLIHDQNSTECDPEADDNPVPGDLREENIALKNRIALMSRQLQDQSRIIECLQCQLKQCRQRALRRTQSALDENNSSAGSLSSSARGLASPPGW